MYELAFTIFGFLLGLVPPWFNRKRRLRTHWCAIRAEMLQCKEKAETLLNDKIASPLYRLPLTAYQTSYSVLLGDGAVSEDEVLVLGTFFGLVQDINRGLDNTAAMHMSGSLMENKIESEYQRNRMKAEKFLKEQNQKPSVYEQAKGVVDRKIALKFWQYAKHA
jgi:hypothetical protein